jgi:4-amino-4-deoxy-L-arabinose transferase-like glycosyltransferase
VGLALALILAVGTTLRFSGLGWGLRHQPIGDERPFVDDVAKMIVRHDLDHRFYEYPGLFLYSLYPVQGLGAPEDPSGPLAYLMARAWVATVSVLNLVLVFALGRRMLGTSGGLAAALLLAVSPVEASVAHEVRPDVMLETFVLLSLLAFESLGSRGGRFWAGLALGGAMAVKFTGLFLVPAYLWAQALRPGPRWRRMAGVLAIAAVVAVAATPYAVIHGHDFVLGVRHQIGAHYQEQLGPSQVVDNVAFYLVTARRGLGEAGAALALVGIALAAREWRRWAPALLLVVVDVGVMSTADIRAQRFLIPVMGVLAMLAGAAVSSLLSRREAAVSALAITAMAVAALAPLSASIKDVRRRSRPTPKDEALDWIDTHLPAGARILETRPELRLGIDPRRFEILVPAGPLTRDLARALAAHADFVITGQAASRHWGSLKAVYVARWRHGRTQLQIKIPARGAERTTEPVPLVHAHISASENSDQLPLVTDGDRATAWGTTGCRPGGAWIRVEFATPVTVTRISLVVLRPDDAAERLQVQATLDGTTWQDVAWVDGRPPVDRQAAALRPLSQEVILVPTAVRGITLSETESDPRPWRVAELRIYGPAAEAAAGR